MKESKGKQFKKLIFVKMYQFITQKQADTYLQNLQDQMYDFQLMAKPNKSTILSYWLKVGGYEVSANRRAVSLSAVASFKYTTTTNYNNDRALSNFLLCFIELKTDFPKT